MSDTWKVISIIISIISTMLVIIKGQTIEEYLHVKYFSAQTAQQTVIKTDKSTDEKITILPNDVTNNEIQSFSEDKAIDSYKAPVGKQIWNIIRIIFSMIAISSIIWFISLICHNDSSAHFGTFVTTFILLLIFVCVYNIFFLKYKFTVNNQYSIESINYTDNTHEQVNIVGYDGNNYSTIQVPTKAILVKKSDTSLLVKYNYMPKTVFGYMLEWKARTSEINVLYLDNEHYSNNIADIINSFSSDSTNNNIEDIKKEFVSYMENTNLSYYEDGAWFMLICKAAIIIAIIAGLVFVTQSIINKKVKILIILITMIGFFVPVIIRMAKEPNYKYTVENTYSLISVEASEAKSNIYIIEYLIGDIKEKITVDENKGQIIKMDDVDTAQYVYKCRKEVKNIYDWFADLIPQTRTVYVIK